MKKRQIVPRLFLALLILSLLIPVLNGCATWQAPVSFDETVFHDRAVSATHKGIRLSAAVLSAEDSRRMFGVNLGDIGVQPVWVEVENSTANPYWLLRAGTDPDYFSPLEVAWSYHRFLATDTNQAIDEHFDALAFENPVIGHSSKSGILFTNPHHQTRLLNVDLLGRRQLVPFSLFLPVPNDQPDSRVRDIVSRFNASANRNFDTPDAFRSALEALPYRATSHDETRPGEPANLVLVGEFRDIAAALVRRGYRKETRDSDLAQQLFGRTPDIVLRKSAKGGAPSNWLRLWTAPLRYQGQAVFLTQAGRPVGGRFAQADGKRARLHPDIDETRNLAIQDLIYSGGLAKLGFVTAGEALSNTAATGFHTDGLRAVMFLASRPRSLNDVNIIDWVPYLKNHENGTALETPNENR